MFCFQCEQTARGTGCTMRAGVRGKPADVAIAQDQLTREMIALAKDLEGKTPGDAERRAVIEGLFTTVTNVCFDKKRAESMTETVAKRRSGAFVPECGASDEPLKLWSADEDIRSLKSLILFGLRGMAAYAYHAMVLGYQDNSSLKSLILFGLRGMAAYAYHAMVLGYQDNSVSDYFFEALRVIGDVNAKKDELLFVVSKVGEMNYACMSLLDHANTSTYGIPTPVQVPLTVEKGPFIVITGHDLKDLELLLKQTEGKGINIYTHGEMLPAHGYPKLRAYPHLRGNFGTSWQNQKKEFDGMPAPVLFTTNCLMPPLPSYSDRVFTTELVAFLRVKHIEKDKDFSPVIEKALELGGYSEDRMFTGIN